MAQPTIKTSFASGEWAPKLRGRVDIQKYHAGAALMRNFFVDFSGGGASTRQGTAFIGQVGANGARLIPFQPSTTLSYVLEFGQNYIRFYSNGAQIVTAPNTPYQITSPYAAADLFPNPLTGNPGIKWVQDVTSMIITHPNYQPQILTINSPTNWTISTIAFGSTVASPSTPSVSSTSATGGGWNYAYIVTAVDVNGQESGPSLPGTVSNLSFIGTTPMTNSISWAAVSGAVSYNVYKASPSMTTAIPAGAQYGFIGNVTGTSMTDAYPGIGPDFAQTPPLVENPFIVGSNVPSYNVTASGSYTVVPTVSVGPPAAGGMQATAVASLAVTSVGGITHGTAGVDITMTGPSDPVNSNLTFSNGLVVKITSTLHLTGTNWQVQSVVLANAGSILSGSTPTNPVAPLTCSAPNFVGFASGFGISFTWGVTQVLPVQVGSGYLSPPAVTFSGGAAAATSVLGPFGGGNPGVCGFIQERLMFANQAKAVQTFEASQPGSFFNFNISNPSQADDSIGGTIIAEELNDIRNLVPVPTGILAMTGKGAWLINGGGGISTQVPITPANVTAQPQAFNGANDLRPLKINMDVLYGTNKGNYVRDLSYNLYAQIFTGSDISVLSNHLFFGYFLPDWAWAEEPFKTMWAVRNDGQLLSLGYVKEQELIGWAHHDTNGQFKSICSVIETVSGNVVDAIYLIVQRIVNGVTVQYVERMADRYFPYGYEDSWSVDCALQTVPGVTGLGTGTTAVFTGANVIGSSVTINFTGTVGWGPGSVGNVIRASGGLFTITSAPTGSQVIATVTKPATNFNQYTNVPFSDALWTGWVATSTVSGLTQLAGQTVVGVADGVAIGPFTVSPTGTVALGLTATKVTLGLPFLPQLQTLPLDLGEPTVQGKRKKITGLTLRVADTLGLWAGKTFSTLVAMKDFTLGNIPTTSTGVAVVNGFVNGDGRTIIDQQWDTAGGYCIQQNLPYPATILAAMPEVTVGDTK